MTNTSKNRKKEKYIYCLEAHISYIYLLCRAYEILPSYHHFMPHIKSIILSPDLSFIEFLASFDTNIFLTYNQA